MAKRRKFTPETKARIVFEIISGAKSIAQASREHQIKDSLLYRWRTEFFENAIRGWETGNLAQAKRLAAEKAELQRMVGKLTMQLEVQKKVSHYVTSLPLESEL